MYVNNGRLAWMLLVLFLLLGTSCSSHHRSWHRGAPGNYGSSSAAAVRMHEGRDYVLIDNGIVQITLEKPGGNVVGVKYVGIDNLLEVHEKTRGRGYMDLVWNWPGGKGVTDGLHGTNFRIITQNEDQVEVSFSRTWEASVSGIAPLNVDRRYIVQRGSAGFYMYAILEHPKEFPEADFDQYRMVFKLQNDKFHYMAISDDIQRVMPTPSDLKTGKTLAYKEATLLTNPRNPELKGQVEDKYMYSMENKDMRLKGWMSNNPPVGFWMITPTDEYYSGGPTKQDLTSHAVGTVLASFFSSHYVGEELNSQFRNGEAWKKVYGPIFIYLNSNVHADYQILWEDAKRQTSVEINKWPYDFVQSQDFPPSNMRGTVSGRLAIQDGEALKNFDGASYAFVGLAPPGDAGSWQHDIKGYQFWTRANRNGDFSINNVNPGVYNLYAWVPGFIGEYKYSEQITIGPGSESEVRLDSLRFVPPRNGPTLWEIGVPDRSAGEFFIPEPSPDLQNKVFLNKFQHRFRQYGLWSRYTDMYPQNDLVYSIGSSNHTQDWFYAHVPRYTNGNWEPTTWQINFELGNVVPFQTYTLQLALASASQAHLNVRLNDRRAYRPLFTTGGIGRDNAIARHGIHGLYRLYTIEVQSRYLRNGQNTLYLEQAKGTSPFQGMMYDYIRLEGPRSR